MLTIYNVGIKIHREIKMEISNAESIVQDIQMLNDIYMNSLKKQNEFVQKVTRAGIEQGLANRNHELAEYLIDIYV